VIVAGWIAAVAYSLAGLRRERAVAEVRETWITAQVALD
jgi:hypothetical protein